jgi:hypothetical protein
VKLIILEFIKEANNLNNIAAKKNQLSGLLEGIHFKKLIWKREDNNQCTLIYHVVHEVITVRQAVLLPVVGRSTSLASRQVRTSVGRRIAVNYRADSDTAAFVQERAHRHGGTSTSP